MSNWLTRIAQKIPQNFWVSIDFDESIAQQLSNKQLNGVAGISDSSLNAMQWFNVARIGMLMMPGSATISSNQLTQIQYGNADQMMQNNMQLMVRIFNQRKPADVVHRIFEYLRAFAKNLKDARYANLIYFMEYTAFWQTLAWNAEDIEVNSTSELAEWAARTAPVLAEEKQGEWGREAMTIPVNDWEYLIRGAIGMIGKVYQDEGEWLLNDKTLRIPTGSTLYIMMPSISEEHRQMWADEEQRPQLEFLGVKDQMQKIDQRQQWVRQYGLDRLYKIRYVDDKQMADQKHDYYTRRDNQGTEETNPQ